MAPKKNKQRERQEMTRAASSARAQEQLLNGGGGAAPSGFIGFSSFATAAPHDSSGNTAASNRFAPRESHSAIAQTIYDGADQDITLALKMLSKKGTVTKIKALNSFLTDIVPPKQPLALRALLGPFVHLYISEVRDQNDRKVRDLVNQVLCLLCNKLKPKAFAPHLTRLLPFWFLAMHDVNRDAARHATNAFETLFATPAARFDVVAAHRSAIVDAFASMFHKTVDTFDGVPLDADEREERYERCVSAAALSLETIVLLFASMDAAQLLLESDDEEDGDASNNHSVASVVSSDAFHKLATATSKHPSFSRDVVRRAVYKTMHALVTRAPVVLDRNNRQEAFGRVILSALSDKSPSNHDAMWTVVLSYLQLNANVWTDSPAFPKFVHSVVVPRLFALIRHGFYGSAPQSFPILLPLLSLLPLDAIGSRTSSTCALYVGVLENIVRFVDSDASRFHETVAIDAFLECFTASFSVFLDANASANWLDGLTSSDDAITQDVLVNTYIQQFERVVKQLLSLAFTPLSKSRLSDATVDRLMTTLVTLFARLTNFVFTKHTSVNALTIQTSVLPAIHAWLRDVVLRGIDKLSVAPTRVNVLVKRGVEAADATLMAHDATEWTQTATAIYKASLAALATLAESTDEGDRAAAVTTFALLIGGVVETLGVTATLAQVAPTESPATHYAAHIRPIVHATATSSTLNTAMLQLCRSFFVAVADKQQFLLDVFADNRVQYGDMQHATAVVTHMLAFRLTHDRMQHWLASGSWSDVNKTLNSELSAASPESELDALRAVWNGKLLDEFLLISVKGRLDDVDAQAFAQLVTATLGGAIDCPVVSPDAVVILCHFVVQSDIDDVVRMRLLPQLLQLFANLSAIDDGSVRLPQELARVQCELYERVFYLAARGSFRSEASTLWDTLVLPVLQRWKEEDDDDKERLQAFIATLARAINALVLAPAAETAPFNTHAVSAFVRKFLLLGDAQDDLATTATLAAQLDVLHLRCAHDDDSKRSLLFSRVLPTLGEIVDNDRIAALIGAYYTNLYAENAATAVAVVGQLVDMDVAHSLTWFVFHSDDERASRATTTSSSSAVLDVRSEILHEFLTLEHLYDELARASPTLLTHVLEQLVCDPHSSAATNAMRNDTTEHRTLLFTHKNNDSAIAAAAATSTVASLTQALTAAQSDDLDALVVAALASYVTPHAKATLLQRLLHNSFAWASRAGLPLVQPLIVSLLQDDWATTAATNKDDVTAAEADADAERTTILATLRAFVEMLATSAQANAQSYLSFVRLAGACWRHVDVASNSVDVRTSLFQDSAYGAILTRMESVLRPGAYASVETTEWILLTEFLSSVPAWRVAASVDDTDKWEAVAKMAITHVVAGKHDVAKVTALKLAQRSRAIRDAVEDEQLVLEYPHELLRARLALLALVHAAARVNDGRCLLALSSTMREALLSIVLCALAECVELKAHAVTTYVSTTAAPQAYDLVQLSLGVEASLTLVLHALHAALACVTDVERVKALVLESFGGVEGLATLFDAARYPMAPKLRALLYVLATHSGALKLRAFDASAIDINADDEAATEAALAKSVIPRAVRHALELEFASFQTVHMTRRRQTPQEREDILGRLLLWDLFLQLFPTSDATTRNAPTMIASALSSFAQRKQLLTNFLTSCATLLAQESASAGAHSLGRPARRHDVLQDTPVFALGDLANGFATSYASDKASVYAVAARVFFRTVLRLPAIARTWWNDECSRSLRSWAAKYFEDHITPFILASELEIIQSASQTHSWDVDEMSVKGSRVSREITTTYVKDECALEMVIRVPASYPLRSVEVECTKRIGIPEDRWRRWVLQIIKVTSSQDGSLLDAVLLWKQNVDKEFEGVEPCPICYSILNPKTMGLPTLPCKTCANKYHNSCLYKWFNQSGKNKCPICQQPFH